MKQTESVTLRRIQKQDENVVRNLFDFAMPDEACRLFVTACLQDGAVHELVCFGSACIGMVSADHGEISYRIRKPWRHHGFASMAVCLFCQRHPMDLWARVERDNVESIAVLKANGFQIDSAADHLLYFTRHLQSADKIAKVGW